MNSPILTGEAMPIEQPTDGALTSELPRMHHSHRLDGRNYLQWSQLVRMFLKGQGKIAHLTSIVPKASDPTFVAWDVKDSMLMLWI